MLHQNKLAYLLSLEILTTVHSCAWQSPLTWRITCTGIHFVEMKSWQCSALSPAERLYFPVAEVMRACSLIRIFKCEKRSEYSSRHDFRTVDCWCSKPWASSDKLKDLKMYSHLYRIEIWVFSLVSFYHFTIGLFLPFDILIVSVCWNFSYGLYLEKNEVFVCYLYIRKHIGWYLVSVFKKIS